MRNGIYKRNFASKLGGASNRDIYYGITDKFVIDLGVGHK